MLTQRTTTLLKSNTRPHYTKLTPLLYGGIRQHGSHGHHHHDADLMNSLKSSSNVLFICLSVGDNKYL